MDKFRFLLTSLPLLLLDITLVQIEGSIVGSDSRFNSEHFKYLTNVLNKSETGFHPSRSFPGPFGYPSSPPLFHFHNGVEPPPPIQQTPHQFYPGHQHHPTFQQTFDNRQGSPRGYPYSPPLPIGYLPTQFGGTNTQTFDLTSPYPSAPFGTPSPYPQFTPPTPKFGYPIPHYPHQHGPFPSPSPPPPRFLDGFDVGSLPKQVQVPGTIEMHLDGKVAEISCEFPKYLILVQGIYWHHMYAHDPFGSYFDTQDGFGNHSTVRAVSQWKSILVIQDYNVDDFGVYRCLSTAVLPAELEATSDPGNPFPSNFKPKFDNSRINPTPPQPTLESPPLFPYESAESGHFNEIPNNSPPDEKKQRTSRFTKNSRKMRFPPIEESSKKRVSRQLPTRPVNQNDRASSAMDLPTSSSTSHLRHYFNFPQTVPYSYQNQEFGYRKLTNPYVEMNPFPRIPSNHNHIQNERHLPQFHFGYPEFAFGIPPAPTYLPPPPPQVYTTGFGFGLKVPYYKPVYSYCTIYQEIKFEPAGVSGRHSRSRTRSRNNSMS